MKSCLVLWEALHWNEMGRFEFQLLYVSPAHLLVLSLMSSRPATREEEEPQRPALGQRAGRTSPLGSTEPQCPAPSRGAAAAGSGLPAAEWVPCPGRCAVAAQDQRTVGLLSRPRGRVMCRTPYCVLGRIFLQFPCFPVGSTCRGWLVIHLTQRPTENTAHCP